MAGCFSSKPYLLTPRTSLRFAPGLASAGTWIDRPRAELEAIARGRDDIGPEPGLHRGVSEPPLLTRPPGHTRPRDFMPLFSGRRVTLVHPWSLTRPRDASIAIGVIHLPFHTQHPWSRQRWDFVMSRMEEICDAVWIGDLRRLGELAVRCERLAARPTLSDGYREAFAALGTTPLAVTPMLPRPPRPGRSFSAYMKQLRRIAPQLFESVASALRRTKLQHHGDEHYAPEHATVPQIARLLGYGGLIPFAALAALALGSSQSAAWIHALIAYGAVILSFVGALHWAFGMLVASSDRRAHDALLERDSGAARMASVAGHAEYRPGAASSDLRVTFFARPAARPPALPARLVSAASRPPHPCRLHKPAVVAVRLIRSPCRDSSAPEDRRAA